MEYQRPEVVVLASALDAIQGDMDKGRGSFDPAQTDPAYVADE
jgi:hypothetical protein